MPKLPQLTPQEADVLLFKAGFEWVRSKGSHRIYIKGKRRVIVPFHAGKVLHPKIVKQLVRAIETAE